MQAAGRQRRQRGNQTVEVECVRVRRDAGAVLTHIEIDQDFDPG